MFAFKPGAHRAAAASAQKGGPSAKRAPSAVRGGRRKDAMTTITADPIITDPALAAPLMTWDVTAPDGTYAGAFQGSTPEDAILSYVATLGYASIDDAALAQGFADAVTYASAFVVTETLAPAGMDPSLAPVDPLAAPAALSRRGRKAGAYVYSVTDPNGGVFYYQADTYMGALEQHVMAQGFASVNDAAAAAGLTRDEFYWSFDIQTEDASTTNILGTPSTLSRRGRRGRKSAGDVRAYLISLGPDTVEQTAMTLWGATSAEMDEFGDVWVEGLADGALPFQMTEDDLYVLATNLGYIAPAEMLGDGYDMPEDEMPPEMLSRRSRLSRKMDVVSLLTDVAMFAGGLAGVAVVAAGVQTLLHDAADYFNSWLTSDGTDQQSMQGALANIDASIAQVQSDLGSLPLDDPTRPQVEQLLADLQASRLNMESAFQSFGMRSKWNARSRKSIARRLRLKATFTVADAETGEVIGTYDATTSDDAILSYVTALGYETVEAAAAGEGFASVEEMLATITVTEGEAAAPAEPETPAETLARRHRLRMKATFEAVDPATGEVLGTFDAGTIDDAILSYAAQLGYGSADEAAAAAGLSLEEWLATFTISEIAAGTEAPPAEAEMEIEIGDEDDDEMEPPAAMSRRGRRARKSSLADWMMVIGGAGILGVLAAQVQQWIAEWGAITDEQRAEIQAGIDAERSTIASEAVVTTDPDRLAELDAQEEAVIQAQIALDETPRRSDW